MIIAGKRIEETKNDEIPLIVILESGHNYFSVFDNNSNLIGLLDEDISHIIIETYINAKALLDEIRYFGILSDKYQEAERQLKARKELIEFLKPQPEWQPIIFPLEVSINAKLSHKKIIEYFSHLKQRHFEVKELFKETISNLQKKLSAL